MAGRGRGSLMNEILMQGSSLSPDALNDVLNIKKDDEVNIGPRKSTTSPLAFLGLRPFDNPLPCAGRGLMTPNQFVKSGQPAPRPLIQSRVSEPKVEKEQTIEMEQTYNQSVADESSIKTKALKDAEHYLKSCNKEQVPQYKSTNQTSNAMQRNSYGYKIANSGLSARPNKNPVADPSTAGKAEAEWQRFKLQRQINRILSNISEDDLEEVVADLKLKLEGNSLSEKFPQYSELRVVLETLIEKSTDSDNFIELGSIIIQKIAEYDIFKFQVTFPAIISSKINEIVKVSASDNVVTSVTKRFCKLLGILFSAPFEEEKRFHSVISTSIQTCIEQWTYPDGIGDEVEGFHISKAETHAYAVYELFEQITLVDYEEERVNELMPEINKMLELIRESVLNECLPRVIREVYLDVLLASAAKWYRPEDKIAAKHERESLVSSIDKNSGRHSEGVQSDGMHELESLSNPSESFSESQFEDSEAHSNVGRQNCLSTVRDKQFDNILQPCHSEAGESHDASVIIEDEAFISDNYHDRNALEKSCDKDTAQLTTDDPDEANETSSFKTDDEPDFVESSEPDFDSNYTLISDVANADTQDPYLNVRTMMKRLKLEDQVERFVNNFIRDTVLNAEREVLKTILKDAGFPAGLIYEICLYLDNEESRHNNIVKSSSRPSTTIDNDASRAQFAAPKFANASLWADPTKASSGGSGRDKQSISSPKEAGPKKKLLGIGRGGNSESGRGGFGPKARTNNWVKPGQDRQWSGSEGSSGRYRNTDRNWRETNSGHKDYGNNSGHFSKKVASPGKTWKSSGFDNHAREKDSSCKSPSSHSDETRQIGKVQPIRKQSREEKKASGDGPAKGAAFDGILPGCLRCGDRDHYSSECKNSSAVFFG